MRLAMLACLFLFGCNTVPAYKQKEYLSYIQQQNELLKSSQISNVEYVERLDAKRIALVGHIGDDDEIMAYMAILAKKRDSGELSKEDARYMILMKQNEIKQRNADSSYRQQQLSIQQGALGLSLINAGAPRSLNSNSINCQSYRTGPITNTNCQ